jgi:hypothetical protein
VAEDAVDGRRPLCRFDLSDRSARIDRNVWSLGGKNGLILCSTTGCSRDFARPGGSYASRMLLCRPPVGSYRKHSTSFRVFWTSKVKDNATPWPLCARQTDCHVIPPSRRTTSM